MNIVELKNKIDEIENKIEDLCSRDEYEYYYAGTSRYTGEILDLEYTLDALREKLARAESANAEAVEYEKLENRLLGV